MLRPSRSFQGHGTAWPSRESLWATCPLWASSGYHAEFQEVAIRHIPVSDAGGQCETKHHLSWTRKRVVAAHYKKDDLLHCWTGSRIFPATMRTFTKDTALSELGRGAAWHVWINARHGSGTAWARDAMCESALWSRYFKQRIAQVHCGLVFQATDWTSSLYIAGDSHRENHEHQRLSHLNVIQRTVLLGESRDFHSKLLAPLRMVWYCSNNTAKLPGSLNIKVPFLAYA